jgi:hypothetical protein
MPADGRPKAPMTLISWRPVRKGSLIGFADLEIPMARLPARDVSVHQAGAKRWARLPGRPMLDGEGTPLRDDKGRVKYSTIVEWQTHGVSAAFSKKSSRWSKRVTRRRLRTMMMRTLGDRLMSKRSAATRYGDERSSRRLSSPRLVPRADPDRPQRADHSRLAAPELAAWGFSAWG